VKKTKLPAPDDASALAFWNRMGIVGPLVALALPLLGGWLLGAFDDFGWERPVTFVSAFSILGAIMFPCAAFLYAQDEWYRALAHASRTWPTVHGVVQESKVKSKLTQYGTLYRLALSYRYEVGRDGYDGDMAEFGPSWVMEKELIEGFAEKYPAGAKVTVHYDPSDPKTSVLEVSDEMARKNSWRIWIFVAAPFVLSIWAAIANAR